MIEIWKIIPGFTRYEVSNLGNLKNIKTKKILKFSLICNYYIVSIYRDDNNRFNQRVHRLVAMAFLPNPDPENKTTVNHKDHNTLNNCVTNLEWASQQEQNTHKRKINPNRKKLISSRPIKLKNIITQEILKFDSMVDACKYIYTNNKELFTNYTTFDDVKSVLKSKMCTTIRKKSNQGILYKKYEPTY